MPDRPTSLLAAAWRRKEKPPEPTPRPGPRDPLTDDERDVLDLEARHWQYGGMKATAIRERFGWSETRYYQVLRSLLDRQAALEHAPALVHRLRDRIARGRLNGPDLP